MKILIVDDNSDNRMTLKLLLEEAPEAIVKEATNGKEAVQMCIDEAFDIVFMDIMMPVMDGIEATRQIRSFDQRALIVAVSALGDDENKERILEAGAKDYMTKPINGDLFIKRFENYRTLISWRQSQLRFISPSINLFNKEVYSRASIFYLRSEADISESWEYFISFDAFGNEFAFDAIQVYFNVALKLLNKRIQSRLLLEENESHYILTLISSSAWNENEILEMVNEHFRGEYKIDSESFSLLIPKTVEVSVPDVPKIGLDDETLKVLRHSHVDKISAATYIEEMSVEFMNKLEGLEVIEESLDVTIFAMQRDANVSRWSTLSDGLRDYAAVIESLFEFQHIVFAIGNLANFIDELESRSVDQKDRAKLLLILSSILEDLRSWRKSIFIESDANDIHYLDSSLLSSCLQARMIFEEKAADNDDLELF